MFLPGIKKYDEKPQKGEEKCNRTTTFLVKQFEQKHVFNEDWNRK